MSSRTAEARAPVSRPRLDLRALPWNRIVAVVVLVLSLVAVQLLFAGPTFVTLTIENPTPYALFVDASGATRGGWTSVTVAGPNTATVQAEVLDEGSTWTFRFTGQGRAGSTLTVTRDELARDGWHVHVPASVQDRLEREGAPPTP